MAQFDVYRNPSGRSAETFPYLVDIQSPFISNLSSRIVIPLARRERVGIESLTRLTPAVTHDQETLLLFTPQIASIPLNQLKNPIGSLAHQRDQIIGALDFAISGI
jgi:toxin CcdB